MSKSVQETQDYLRSHGFGVLVTTRRNGLPQVSPVGYLYHEGRLLLSTTRNRAKYKNIKGNGNIAFCVLDQQPPFGYMSVYGRAEIIEDDRQVIALSELLFRSFGSNIPGDFAEQLKREQRIVIAIHPDRIVPQPPPSLLAQSSSYRQED